LQEPTTHPDLLRRLAPARGLLRRFRPEVNASGAVASGASNFGVPPLLTPLCGARWLLGRL